MNNKVAMIFPSKIVGGHEIMAIKLAQDNYSSCGVDYYIHQNNHRLRSLLTDSGCDFFYHPISQRSMEIFHTFLDPFRMVKALLFTLSIKSKYKTIILAQGDIELGSVFIVAGKILNVKLVSYIPYVHSFKVMNKFLGGLRDILARVVYRCCNDYITISDCFRYDLINKNNGASVEVIKNNVSPPSIEWLRRRTCHIKTNSSDGIIRIYIVGRVSFFHKGHDILVSSLSLLSSDAIGFSKIELHVVGDGPDMEILEKICKSLPQSIVTYFHGWVVDCWDIAIDADLIVIPSRYEGVPLVMLEAISRSIPVLASNKDGMADYIDDSNGILFDVGRNDIETIWSLKSSLEVFISHLSKVQRGFINEN